MLGTHKIWKLGEQTVNGESILWFFLVILAVAGALRFGSDREQDRYEGSDQGDAEEDPRGT